MSTYSNKPHLFFFCLCFQAQGSIKMEHFKAAWLSWDRTVFKHTCLLSRSVKQVAALWRGTVYTEEQFMFCACLKKIPSDKAVHVSQGLLLGMFPQKLIYTSCIFLYLFAAFLTTSHRCKSAWYEGWSTGSSSYLDEDSTPVHKPSVPRYPMLGDIAKEGLISLCTSRPDFSTWKKPLLY